MITGITHVAYRVTDIERSIEFYTKLLGLKERFRMQNDSGKLVLVYLEAAPGQFIELFPGAAGPSVRSELSGAVHVCFQVDDIQRTYAEMTSAGPATRGEPILAGDNSWQFWTSDPDGNPIEFHQFTSDSLQFSNRGDK